MTDHSIDLCVTGIANVKLNPQDRLYPYPQLEKRVFDIGSPEQNPAYFSEISQPPGNLNPALIQMPVLAGKFRGGIPWLFTQTSEEFVPQMFKNWANSINRFKRVFKTGKLPTHYLGKNKRAMYQASSTSTTGIQPGCSITDGEDNSMGTVVLAAQQDNTTKITF
ncbi:MAG: hypothetical protein H0A75_08745 [Candidatus Methanofishera endochildressiae]|uniref:Uncharacterized protein n=1 Tax=Candidatus Methanofishera endochildressiae TaxID=2738884 RepID=A0A7Z0MQN3_9GAMM|nr:hypothetical protein [Candidatus Methanofishera endochildressiae]